MSLLAGDYKALCALDYSNNPWVNNNRGKVRQYGAKKKQVQGTTGTVTVKGSKYITKKHVWGEEHLSTKALQK